MNHPKKDFMRHVLCHIVLVCAFALGAVAQEVRKDSVQATVNDKRLAQNNVSLELIGNGLFYSVNYERTIITQNFSLRIGASYIPQSGNNDFGTILLPILMNAFIGESAHRLEVGLGGTIFLVARRWLSFTGRIGYRYQPLEGGFNFGIAFTPILGGEIYVPVWGGISLGWGF